MQCRKEQPSGGEANTPLDPCAREFWTRLWGAGVRLHIGRQKAAILGPLRMFLLGLRKPRQSAGPRGCAVATTRWVGRGRLQIYTTIVDIPLDQQDEEG